MIEDLQVLLGLEDGANDKLIRIYIDRAVEVILNYLNNDKYDSAYILDNFETAVTYIVENMHNSKDTKFIRSQSQGNRSVSYNYSNSNIMTNDVKNLLPLPRVRLR